MFLVDRNYRQKYFLKLLSFIRIKDILNVYIFMIKYQYFYYLCGLKNHSNLYHPLDFSINK